MMGDKPRPVAADILLSEFEETSLIEVEGTAPVGVSTSREGRGYDLEYVAIRDAEYGWIAVDIDRVGVHASLLDKVHRGDRFRVVVDDGDVASVEEVDL